MHDPGSATIGTNAPLPSNDRISPGPPSALVVLVFLFVAWATGCNSASDEIDGAPTARILIYGTDPGRSIDAAVVRAAGLRDGVSTRARFVFADTLLGSLEIDLEVHHDPQPVLQSGSWTLSSEGGTTSGTEVTADDLRFLGGQGGRPSLGGRFVLGRDGTPRCRVDFPPLPLEPEHRGGVRTR